MLEALLLRHNEASHRCLCVFQLIERILTGMRTLTTDRFVLEPQGAVHAAAMFQVLSDPAIHEFEDLAPASEAALRERFQRLESRGRRPGHEADDPERWLNWVIRMPDGALAGFVQATVLEDGRDDRRDDGSAYVAFVLHSRYWHQGIGSAAVRTMAHELQHGHGVHTALAVLKARNHRSRALLDRLGFVPADAARQALHRDGPDEIVCVRTLPCSAAGTASKG